MAVQGDFEKHLRALARLGVEGVEVRNAGELSHVDGLILPGGESTTVGLLMQLHGLGDAIRQVASEGMPVLGTCMGMILMARQVEGREQYTLGLLDATVRRNAFGAQVHSFEDSVRLDPLGQDVTGVFIRAPIVVERGPEVEVVAQYEGKVVGVRQGRRVGISFHPELTDDTRFHEWFLTL